MELDNTPDSSEAEGASQVDQKVLDEAMSEGWRPKEDFHGPEDQWVDAETFVKRGREINPILRKNNEKLQRELSSVKEQVIATNASLRKMEEYYSKLEERAYEKAVSDLKSQRKQARAEGDMDSVDLIDEEIETLKTTKPEPIKVAPAAPAVDPTLAEWMTEQSSWFNNQNPELMDYANAVAIRLRREDPESNKTGRIFLDEITRAVKKQFPDKFGGRRGAPAAVGGGGDAASSTGRSSGKGAAGIAELPPEARQAYKELHREDWYVKRAKELKLTTEQLYLQDYEA